MVRRQPTPRDRSRLLVDPTPRDRHAVPGALLRVPRRRRHRKALAVAVVLWLVLPVIALAWTAGAPAADAASSLVEIAGRLPVTQSAQLYVDSEARRLYLLDPLMGIQGVGDGIHQGGQAIYNGDPGVRILDADTYQPVGDDIDLGPGASPVTAEVDETNHLLFVDFTVFQAGPAVLIIDPAQHAVTDRIGSVAPVGYTINNLAFDATTRQLYVEASAANKAVVVSQVDVDEALATGTASPVTALLPQCENVASGHSFGVNKDAVYAACTGLDLASVHQPDTAQGIYTVPFTDAGGLDSTNVKFFPVPGGYVHGGAVFDPESGRMALFTRAFGPSGALVFDGAHQAMVGIIGQEGNFQGACVDKRTGRFYTLTDYGTAGAQDSGLIVGEIRPTPTPQGLGFPQLSGQSNQDVPYATRDGQDVCDSTGHRLLYKVASQNDNGTYTFSYIVLADHIADYVPPPPPPDPDTYTSNVPDDPAKSLATYEADGRAFGARAVFAGGYSNLVLNLANFNGILDPLVLQQHPPQCPPQESGLGCGSIGSTVSPATRWIVLGAVGQPGNAATVSLSNATATAAAAGGARDEATVGDMTQHGTRDDGWPYAPTVCSQSPGSAAQTSASTGASATCDPDGGAARADSNATGFMEIPGVVRVTGAASAVETKLDAAAGIIVTAAARAGAVSLGDGQLEIDDIEAVATSQARGLPGSAKAEYTRSAGRLTMAGNVVCEPCDLQSVVDAINALPNLNVHAVLPSLDADAVKGTAGGYQASVVRDPWEQRTDEVVNEISDYDRQVPALRLIVNQDAYQHSAMIIDLAAPAAEAHRGLQACEFCALQPATTTTEAPTTTTTEAPAAEAAVEEDAPTTLPPPASTTTTAAPRPSTATGLARPIPLASSGSTTRTITITKGAVRKPATAAKPKAILPRIGGAVSQAAGQVLRGIEVLFSSPHRIFELVLVWAVLAVPVYLASRRRLITQRMV